MTKETSNGNVRYPGGRWTPITVWVGHDHAWLFQIFVSHPRDRNPEGYPEGERGEWWFE